MKKQLFLSLLVLLITLPLFAFKAVENIQQIAIPQFALVDKSILTSGNLEIEYKTTMRTDIDNAVIKNKHAKSEARDNVTYLTTDSITLTSIFVLSLFYQRDSIVIYIKKYAKKIKMN